MKNSRIPDCFAERMGEFCQDVIIIRIIMCHHAMKRFMDFRTPGYDGEKSGFSPASGEKSHGYAAEVIVSYLEEQLICQK